MAVDADAVGISLGRTFVGLEAEQVEQWIEDARLLIKTRLGDLDALDQDLLDYVVREAAAARARNPEGYQSETVDDYTYRYGSQTRQVTILDEWWNLLDPDTGSGAFAVRPGFEPDDTTASSWA